MINERWVTAALSNDTVVAELLISLKQPSTSFLPRITWGYRKSRSKPPDITNAVNGSPTTPLYWNRDGYEESCRPSDLSSGGGARSTKDALVNEGATTSNYKKSKKRKLQSFAELKEEEDFLMKERLHLNRELDSMRVAMSNQIATSQHLKKFKTRMHQNPKQETEKKFKTITHQVQTSYVMQTEPKVRETGFVLPDLNTVPYDEEIYRI